MAKLDTFFRPKTNLAAAIIGKNNEATIEATLQSISQFCSQVVFVDTGSDDSTPCIASRYGAEVHFYKWNDSFSDARNYALSYVRRDWILNIDTDETLQDFDLNNFNAITENENCGGIYVRIDNLLENGLISTHRYPRIIKNHPQIRFNGTIHEQVNTSIYKLNLEIFESDISILHTGYSQANAEKTARNRDLLLKSLAKNPKDTWSKYQLAITEFADNNTEKAEALFSEILNSDSLNELGTEQIETSKIRLAQIQLGKGNYSALPEHLAFTSSDVDLEGFRQFLLLNHFLYARDEHGIIQTLNSREIRISKLVDQNIIKQILLTIKAK